LAKSLLKTRTGQALKQQVAGTRWKESLAMFSTMGGLQEDIKEAFNR
jgi:hypothetical protein